jgi:kynurenine formamidase
MAGKFPSEDEVLGYFDSLSNWGRWGKHDQLGTLNFLSAAKTRRALELVEEGVTISCARTISTAQAPDVHPPPLHYMLRSGEAPDSQVSMDFIGMVFHGYYVTHMDSLAHIFWDGHMYNGLPASLVTGSEGATVESIELMKNGVLARGVLVDVPFIRGIDWMEPGDSVMPEDILAAEDKCGFVIEEGDVLLVRTGHTKRRQVKGPWDIKEHGQAACQAACLPLLHERRIAILGGDTGNDVMPYTYSKPYNPIHKVGMVAMGLWIMDNANLEDLAEACKFRNRWRFLIAICPLRLEWGTGSPVNPMAVF